MVFNDYTYWNSYWYKIYASDWMIPAGLNFDRIQLNLVGGWPTPPKNMSQREGLSHNGKKIFETTSQKHSSPSTFHLLLTL